VIGDFNGDGTADIGVLNLTNDSAPGGTATENPT
jgi:hypothetical protein